MSSVTMPRMAAHGEARLPPPPRSSETVALRDGTTVEIRLIRTDDAPGLQALYSRLSAESLYFRFLEIRKGLSAEELKRMATLDYQTHPTLVATLRRADREDIIAAAGYTLIETGEPGLAELSIVVEDCYQGRRLGTLLLKRLVAYARSHGVRTFIALVHPENIRMIRLIRHSGLSTRSRTELGTREFRIELGGSTGYRNAAALGWRGRSFPPSSSAVDPRIP